jgi:hypothetical protein
MACFSAGCIILLRFLVENFLYAQMNDYSEKVDLFVLLKFVKLDIRNQ